MTNLLSLATRTAFSLHQSENVLTDCLAAAVNHSPTVREVLLSLLWRGAPTNAQWECLTQRRGDYGGEVGFVDLLIRRRLGPGRKHQELVIENKVGAPLTKDQLLKYRRVHLRVAVITKHYPEPGRAWLKQLGIAAIRWQDLHRGLRAVNAVNAKDRFVLQSFVDLLEDQRMAYADVSHKDLDALATTLKKISGESPRGLVGKLRFDVADQVINYVEEVQSALKDRLASRGFVRSWGPGYWNEDEDGRKSHCFGFALFRAGRSSKQLQAYLCVDDAAKAPLVWKIEFLKYSDEDVTWLAGPTQAPIRRFFQGDTLSTARLTDSVVRFVTHGDLRA